jgi:hypothetical protein
MTSMSRRDALKLATATGAAASIPALNAAAQDAPQANADRGFVLAAGMTEGEADCWEFAAKTAGAFFALPEMHPMDAQEVASAIHIIQNKLLSRPTYRKYLELAKAHHDE